MVTHASEKRKKNIESWKRFLKRDGFTVRELSSLTGTFTFEINLEKLKKAKGNFDTHTLN